MSPAKTDARLYQVFQTGALGSSRALIKAVPDVKHMNFTYTLAWPVRKLVEKETKYNLS